MIKSDAQLQRTEAQIEAFRRTVAELEQETRARPPEVREAVLASHQGMIRKLQAEVSLYQDLKRGLLRLPRLTGVKDFGACLVRFRIALGLTQEQLADLVDVARQTINKHEEQEYQAAPVVLVARVSEALGVLPEIAVRHKRLAVQQPASAPAAVPRSSRARPAPAKSPAARAKDKKAARPRKRAAP